MPNLTKQQKRDLLIYSEYEVLREERGGRHRNDVVQDVLDEHELGVEHFQAFNRFLSEALYAEAERRAKRNPLWPE